MKKIFTKKGQCVRIYKTHIYYVKAYGGSFNVTLDGRELLKNKYGELDEIKNGCWFKDSGPEY